MSAKQLAFLTALPLILASLACSTMFAPTATPPPTDTPTITPSPTPIPTDTATATPTPVPTDTPSPTPTDTPVPQPGDVVLSDAFNDNDNQWDLYAYDSAPSTISISDGLFTFHLQQKSVFYPISVDSQLADVDMTFEATLAEGAGANTLFGGICRKVDRDNFYLFAIAGNGYYTITKYVNDQWTALIDWKASGAIRTGKATNVFRIICLGDTLQLSVNNRVVATARDSQFKTGAIGLVVGTFAAANPSSKVSFDNLVVKVPETVAATGGGTSTGGGGTAATKPPQATRPPAATATGNGRLVIVMCQGIEVTITIFSGGQIFKQESLHNAGRNVYELPPGKYDVQLAAAGYNNLNLQYDVKPGSEYVQYIGSQTC